MRQQDRLFLALSVAFAMQSSLALAETPPAAPIEPLAAPPFTEPPLTATPLRPSLGGLGSFPPPILSASAGLPGSSSSSGPTFQARDVTAYQVDCCLHLAESCHDWGQADTVVVTSSIVRQGMREEGISDLERRINRSTQWERAGAKRREEGE